MYEGKSLDEVGLLAYTDNAEPVMLNVLLGSVQVVADEEPTLAPLPVTNICCDEMVMDKVSLRSDLPPEDDCSQQCLSMRLYWTEPNIAADVTAYEIWYGNSSVTNCSNCVVSAVVISPSFSLGIH